MAIAKHEGALARGLFLLMRNGVPLSWTGPHGPLIDWFGPMTE